MPNTIFGQTARKIGGPLGAVAFSSATTSMLLCGGQSSQRSTTLKATQNASRYLFTYSQPRSLIHRAAVKHEMRPQSFIPSPTVVVKSKRTFSTRSEVSSTTTKSASKGNGGFVEWYENHLQNRPVTTKAVTGSILWGLGDFVAQVVPTVMQDTQKEHEQVEKKEFQYDYPRTARAMFFGFGIHAPLSHLHFNFLEWMTVRGGFTGLGIPVFKTVMEQVSDFLIFCLYEILVSNLAHYFPFAPPTLIVCILELDFEFTLPWSHGGNAGKDIRSDI